MLVAADWLHILARWLPKFLMPGHSLVYPAGDYGGNVLHLLERQIVLISEYYRSIFQLRHNTYVYITHSVEVKLLW